ncbi:MAG: alpha/beta hydrolase [Flavisolibacter sp.]|nr:alpha/beta hydrolase [Flavisolibacter sp.]
MQEKKQLFKNKKLVYKKGGTGPVVVLLHGFGEEGTVWDGQVPHLKQSNTLIIPDLPGSGGSEMIHDMTIEGLAESVYAILHQEGVEQCIIIGHSMGGYITLAFAERWSTMLQGFSLFHSTTYADSEEKKAAREKGIAFIRQHGAIPFLKAMIPDLFCEKSKKEKPHIIEKHLKSLHNFSDAALVSYYESMMRRPARTSLLQKVHIPVLFVLGRWDNAVPLQDGLTQSHLPEISYIHILEESGHMGMLEEPEKATLILKDYLYQAVKYHHTA